jgi:ABC-type branched-subunit amino acid transport system ATPase component/ABC-type branched-subunit amino acid transport system permease subunit
MSAACRHPVLWVLLVFVALTVAWDAIGAPVSLITQIAIYTLYGAGVNLLVGYTGLVPFGASVFFGCASYAVAIAMRGFLDNEAEALVFAVAFSLLLAAAIALIILRRRGLYFSLLTLAFSQIAFEIAYKWTDLTGGENGLQGVPRPWLAGDWSFHVFTLITVCAGMWLLWRIAHAPFGRALQALRDNEQRMQSLGYSTFRLKFEAFVILGGTVGYAGALLALMLRGAYADNLGWQHAGDALLMTVLGGVHQFLGPLWGAIAFTLLQDRLSAITESWWLIFAPIIILFALLSPEGIQGAMQRLLRRPQRWTLVRNEVPARPAHILPFHDMPRPDMHKDQPILTVRGLHKRFGSLVVAQDVHLDVHPFRLHSLIGPNGAGKTTFFNMLTGLLRADAGEIRFDGNVITHLPVHRRIRLGLSRSFQILSVFRNLTTFENVRVAVQAQSKQQDSLWRDAYALAGINERTWSLLAAVGLEHRAAEPCATLSHGEQRLLEIAISLATDAKLLLLDEPLAGLGEADREVVGALIRQLTATHAVLLIEHDIDRVLALSDRITVLHQGRIIADGKPAEVANDPQVITAYMGTARAGAPQPAVQVERAHQVGEPLLVIDKVRAGYAGSLVLTDVDLTVREGEAIALLGRNGVGKTTMLRAITGTVQKSTGRIVIAGVDITRARPYEINRLGISIVPEGRRLFPNLTVTENLQLAARSGGASFSDIFELFPKLRVLQRARAESLSGGERQMLAIARALAVPSRLILLDEPFEGLAPSVVQEVMDALVRLRGRVGMIIVEHHAETVLPIVDRAYVLVNGQVAYEGGAKTLEADADLQARLLGVVHQELTAA